MPKKFFIFIMGVITSLLLCAPIFAENFYIENYRVDIQVNKSKQAHVTEKIDVYFTSSSHGIYRDIPHNNATITNIRVSENNQITDKGLSTNVKIGNPSRLVSGQHSYTISYDYNFFDNKNEFYYNIIGTNWDTEIKHVSFNITMPEKVNMSDVGLSIGKYGVKGFEGGAEFRVDGLNISGQINRTLNSKEGATIRIKVPEGYFYKADTTKSTLAIILICILTLVSFLIWYQFGKDEKAIPVVNFYPPEDMNVLETEIAYKEKASIKGLVAMLISLAQKGFIKIYEEDDGFTLESLKPYDGKDKMEQAYFSALFRYGSKVTKKDLKVSHTFYKECEEIVDTANSKRNCIYEQTSVSWSLRILMALCLLGVVVITFLAFLNFDVSEIGNLVIPLLFMSIAVFILIFSKEKSPVLFIWAFCFGAGPLFGSAMVLFNIAPYNVPVAITGLVCTIICSICLYHLKKRNRLALEVLGDLLGFKKFIETAEKNKLVALVCEEPQYFYNILPYAYLFDISDKWIKNFEGVMDINPSWYQGKNFNYRSFRTFYNTMNSLSVPSVSNGGVSTRSSGGGGFSGGGGGGGGGGSW